MGSSLGIEACELETGREVTAKVVGLGGRIEKNFNEVIFDMAES